jgi:uncharacterized protein YndB with AHSA1/START domain
MSRNSIMVDASPSEVFAVLEDPDAYAQWVVGARRIRRVDPDWPREGSEFHHAIGVAGAELHDSSKVVERNPPHRIVLDVRFRPTGTARVEIEVEPVERGSRITIAERPSSGPVVWVPLALIDPVLHLRNAWSLQRLRCEVEQRARSAL